MDGSAWSYLVVLLAGAVVGYVLALLVRGRPPAEPEFTGALPAHDSHLLDDEYLSGELTRSQYEAEQHHQAPHGDQETNGR